MALAVILSVSLVTERGDLRQTRGIQQTKKENARYHVTPIITAAIIAIAATGTLPVAGTLVGAE